MELLRARVILNVQAQQEEMAHAGGLHTYFGFPSSVVLSTDDQRKVVHTRIIGCSGNSPTRRHQGGIRRSVAIHRIYHFHRINHFHRPGMG